MLRSLVIPLIMIASLVGFAKAQESDAKKVDREAEQQVLKLEHEKVDVLLKGGSVAADWFSRVYADDISYTTSSGMAPKSQTVDDFRSGARQFHSIQHDDYRVCVYNNGNTAVLTYRGNDSPIHNGTVGNPTLVRTTDVYVKQNGVWRIVVHSVVPQK